MPFRSESIDELCSKAKITQHKLCAELGTPQSQVYRWKFKKTTPKINNIDLLYQIAKKYRVEVEFYINP
ncbi:helix-turn-helix transcriptional regulator [archaeon]|nr:helix-turn-helix transcriptional regulator [archaeon]